MKVIQILPELNAGGVERGTLEVGKYLVDQGHESIVISNGGRLVTQLEAEGSRHITLPVHKKRLSSLKQVKVLRRLFEEERPDILHLRSRLPAWLAYLAWRKMDPQTRPRLVTTVHGFNSVNAYSSIMTKGEQVICVSNCVKDYILKHYPKLPKKKLQVVHRGVDPSLHPFDFQPCPDWLKSWHREFPETQGRKLLTLPGRITRLKGHDDFLKLVDRLPDNYHGVIAGGADPKKANYLAEVEATIQSAGLERRVTLTGHRSDLREIMAISYIVLSLTQQPESFGRTTLEALCLGRPVIGYQHGGVGEILNQMFPQGKVDFGDVDSILGKIEDWDNQPERPLNINPFTLEKMLNDTIALYDDLYQTK